jgi:hypothetical protein
MDEAKPRWEPGSFYVLEGKPDEPGDPVMQAVITKPGATSSIELVVKMADIPIIGAAYNEDEMEKAKEAGEMIVDRFWPSDEALKAILAAKIKEEEVDIETDGEQEDL